MKKFFSYFQDYFSDGFDWRLHLIVMVFVGFSVWLNFSYGKHGFERDYIGYRSWESVLGFFFLQAFPFYVVIALQSYFKQDWSIFQDATFWWVTIVGFIILAFSRGFPYTMDIAEFGRIQFRLWEQVVAVDWLSHRQETPRHQRWMLASIQPCQPLKPCNSAPA